MSNVQERPLIWFAASIARNSPGGVGRVMQELSARLARRESDCVIVDAGTSGLLKNYLVFFAWLAAKYVFSFEKRPAWIIARSTDGLGAALLARLFGLSLKTALHSHGWEEKAYEAERLENNRAVFPKTTWKARIIRFPMLRIMLALCDICVCGTIEEARWIKRKYPALAAKVVCVPNGVTVYGEKRLAQSFSAAPQFLAVGGATWKKNIAYTLNVFRGVSHLVPRARLTVIGISESHLASLAGTPIVPGVKAVTYELPEAMDRWYAASPFFLTLSRYEGGRSLAMLEAMAHGCVVFASPIPSSLECIVHSVDGFILTGHDSARDTELIVKALADPVLCAKISRGAFLFAKRQSWERQARRLERILWTAR